MSKKEANSLESRSEEISDIIERMPTGWTRLVVGMVSVLVATVAILGWYIRYPDTVSGPITIIGTTTPIRIVAPTSGRLHLLASNNTWVEEGSSLGVMENGASYADVVRLDEICHFALTPNLHLMLPAGLRLGSLGAPYNDFVLSYRQFDQLRQTKAYGNMRKALMGQRQSSANLAVGLQRQITINEDIQDGVAKQYQGDSVLHSMGALSDEAVSLSWNKLQERRKVGLDLRQSLMVRQAEGRAVEVEMVKLDIEASEKLRSAFYSMQSKHSVLCNEVRLWKERYLVRSPIRGTLEYLGFWHDEEFVPSATELFSVIPKENAPMGEMTIPSSGAGKVAVGQEVKIRLFDYPYDEFGYVRGRVEKVSSIGRKVEGVNGMDKSYLVLVSLSDGVRTNYGKRLTAVFELSGTGDIVTKKRRLVERLFDNIQNR